MAGDVPRAGWAWVIGPLLLGGLGASGVSAVAAPATLALLAWLPGALLLRATGWGARHDGLARLTLALAWSQALVPAMLNIAWHYTNRGAALALAAGAATAVAAAIIALGGRGTAGAAAAGGDDGGASQGSAGGESGGLAGDRFTPAPRWAVWGLAALVVAVVLVGPVGNYWPAERGGVPVPAVIHDYIKHHAVMFCLQERPLPLGNPFFADGATEPVYYYHFFYLIPATVRAVTNGAMSIELAFGLGSALVALTTIALAFVWARQLSGCVAGGLVAALLCSVIGGWDAAALLVEKRFTVTLDAWADTPLRVHNLLTQFIWTPQNMLGLLIALLAAYTLRVCGFSRAWLLLGPWLAHSMLGASVWIAAAMLPGIVPLVLFEVWRRRLRPAAAGRLIGGAVAVAALTLAVTAPLLMSYADTGRRHGGGLTLEWDDYSKQAWLGRVFPPGALANAADLVWILPLEFGPLMLLPLMAGREWWRRAWADSGMRWLMIVSAGALAVFPIVRSNFTYNDLGHRVTLVPLLTGALLSAGVAVHAGAGGMRRRWGRTAVIAAAMLMGAPVGLWQAPAGAVRRFVPPTGSLGRLCAPPTAMAREDGAVWRFLRYETPREAVVQAEPGFERLTLAQLANRQIGVMPLEQDTHVFQGRDATVQQAALAEVRAALADEPDAARAAEILRRHGITHVLVGAVERRKWTALEKFDDASAFERVYEDGETSVYRVGEAGR